MSVRSIHQQKYVLVSSGTYSPIHLLHLGILECAKSFLESKDMTVVGGYLVPGCKSFIVLSNPLGAKYAKKKLGEEAISVTDRVALTKIACDTTDWLDVCDWDATMPGYGSTGFVILN